MWRGGLLVLSDLEHQGRERQKGAEGETHKCRAKDTGEWKGEEEPSILGEETGLSMSSVCLGKLPLPPPHEAASAGPAAWAEAANMVTACVGGLLHGNLRQALTT